MPSQPTPNVTGADVERVVRRDFPGDRAAEVLAILDEYGTERWHRESDRVRLAALKLALGNIEHLRQAIEMAKGDYRDVLAVAEYPGYCQQAIDSDSLSPEQEQQIIDADSKQYQDWLLR